MAVPSAESHSPSYFRCLLSAQICPAAIEGGHLEKEATSHSRHQGFLFEKGEGRSKFMLAESVPTRAEIDVFSSTKLSYKHGFPGSVRAWRHGDFSTASPTDP
ncbi:hypothetical protein CLAIMM_03501 [Cladophialophora immunda]|nr:hypothetical protein CLAIMM_03501 [Cladophialophora immunda]